MLSAYLQCLFFVFTYLCIHLKNAFGFVDYQVLCDVVPGCFLWVAWGGRNKVLSPVILSRRS